MEIFQKKKKNRFYPVLIVEQLPKSFGTTNKEAAKKPFKISKEEEIILTLIARIAVEIFITEEL